MELFLDTNIYRNFVRGLSFFEIERLANKIKENENMLGYSAGFPIVVAMELISHLVPGDPHLVECYKALYLLFNHSKNYNAVSDTLFGKFYPPQDVVLSKYFLNEDGPDLKTFRMVIPLVKSITENCDLKNINKFQAEILATKEHIKKEKEQFQENLVDYLKTLNGGTLDWKYFKQNKNARRKWFRDMETGEAFVQLAEGFMSRTFSISNKDFIQNQENWDKLKEFHDHFFPAIAMTSLLLEPIGHGVALDNLKDSRWNTVQDISIMFGVLFESNFKDKVFVSEEKKMHQFFKLNGMQEKIIDLNDFKKMLKL
jgi:hypothetical protein